MTRLFVRFVVASQKCLDRMFRAISDAMFWLVSRFYREDDREFFKHMAREDRKWECWHTIAGIFEKTNSPTGYQDLFKCMIKDGEVLGLAEPTLEALNYIKGRYSCPLAPMHMIDGMLFSDKSIKMYTQAEALERCVTPGLFNFGNKEIFVDRLWFDRCNYIGVCRIHNYELAGLTILAFFITRGVMKDSDTMHDAFSLVAYFEKCRKAVANVYFNTPSRDQGMAEPDRSRSAQNDGGVG